MDSAKGGGSPPSAAPTPSGAAAAAAAAAAARPPPTTAASTMPRSSLADLMDRISLGRASLGGGGGSFHRRGSLYSDISSGSSATRHWVNSVSDIYGPDEIEELLDELNRLEMAGLESTNDPEEEYDVDGSHCGVGGHPSGSRHHQHHHHRRKPHNRSSSPAFSVRSWDSHAFQASHPQRLPAVTVPLDADGSDDDGGGAGGAVSGVSGEDDDADRADGVGRFRARNFHSVLCYCDTSTLKSPRTILRIVLLVRLHIVK